MTERTHFARHLRREQSDVEALMWTQLRARRFCNLKFRRQVPVSRYTADFLCESEKLIVEIDGWQHTEQAKADEARSRVLESYGYRIVRFWSDDVRYRLSDVLEELKAHVGDSIRFTDRHDGEGIHFPSSAPPGHLLPKEKGRLEEDLR